MYLAPVAFAVRFNPAYAYWLVSSVAIVALVVSLWRGGPSGRAAAMAVNGATAFGNFLLAASLYLQGTGFNAQFFHHLDGETFAIARDAYAYLFFGSWLYWLLLCAMPFAIGPGAGKRRRLRIRLGLAGIALLAYAPLLSLIDYAVGRLVEERSELILPMDGRTVVPEPLDAPRNLVLVFAESMEATYSRRDLFGADLTPRLTALAEQGVRFGDMRQVRHTDTTITGMIAALCARPLVSDLALQNANALVPTFGEALAGELCLGDVLAAHGYRTVFLGGAPLAFAGKGAFLESHGFHERYGRTALLSRLPDPSYRSGWGIHDDSLFAFAHEKLDALARDQPFALALLTLDTHHPSGIPSASCGAHDGSDTAMEFAIRCSDRLLARFIETVRERHPGTVVALLSDHLAHRNDLAPTLRANAASRRLRFAIWGSHLAPMAIEKRGTHYDIMPTLLDALGFERWRRHNLGASLLRFESPWWEFEQDATVALTRTLPDIVLKPDDAIVFEAKGPTIHLGGIRLLATNDGLELDDSIFTVEFEADGKARGFRRFATLDEFLRAGPGRRLVGVSSNADFNRRFGTDRPTKLTYFAGRFPEGFAARPLWWREAVNASGTIFDPPAEPPSR